MRRNPQQPSVLSQAFSILHSFFSAVVLFFCLGLLDRTNFLTHNALISFLEDLTHIGLRIFIYSAVYGTIIELVSGEHIIVSFSKFLDNAKKYWYIYAILEFFVFSINLSLFSSFPNSKPLEPYIPVHTDLLLQYVFAYTFIYRKHILPFKIPRKKYHIPFQYVRTITGLAALYIVFHHAFIPFANHDSLIMRAGLFFAKYLQLLLFTVISLCLIEIYSIKSFFTHKKEIYFIVPPGGTGIFQRIYYLLCRPYPPVFIILKALSPKGYHFRDLYQIIWRDRYYASGKLVAISCLTQTTPEVYEIAKTFKERGSKVILGGLHASIFPDEALEYCDSVVIGEAESVWPAVIRDYENGSLRKTYIAQTLDAEPDTVHQALLQSPPEQIKSCLETSRGCKFHCEFCSIPILHQGRIRHKPVSEIIELLQKVRKKYRFVNLRDSNLYNDPRYFQELCTSMIPLKLTWEGFSSIDIGSNEKMLRLAKESGCRNLGIGYEIIASSPEKKQGGKYAMSEKYYLFTQRIKNAGIRIKANFTIGFESDSLDIKSLFKLWKFCFALRPYKIGLGVLTPFPGTQLYSRMLKENRLTTLNWQSYSSLYLVFKHKHINKFLLDKSLPFLVIFFFLTTTQAGYMTIGILVLIFLL